MSFRRYDPIQVGGMLVYEGSRRQRGGGLLDSLKSFALPIGKKIAAKARGAFMKTGKDLARRGIGVGVGALADRLRRGPSVKLKETFANRATAAADKAVKDYLGDGPDIPFISQDGFGLKRRRKSINKMKARRKPAKRRKAAPKKRKASKRRDIFS